MSLDRWWRKHAPSRSHRILHLFHDIKQRDKAGSFNQSAMEQRIQRDPAIE
jgi:hypothetical protein